MHLQHYTPISTLVLCKYAETINLYCTKLQCLYCIMLHCLERVPLNKSYLNFPHIHFKIFLIRKPCIYEFFCNKIVLSIAENL